MLRTIVCTAPWLLVGALLTACVAEPGDAGDGPDAGDLAAADPEIADHGTGYLRTAEGILPIVYDRQGDYALIQEDIAIPLDDLDKHLIAAEDLDDALAGLASHDRAAVRAYGSARWPGGVIPFQFASGLSMEMRGRVNEAITEWETKTSFRFRAKTSADSDYLTFRSGSGLVCWSELGRQGGQQYITLPDVCEAGRIMHEIGHTVGFFHEQSRYDRDQFVTIIWNNILQEYKAQYEQYVDPGSDGWSSDGQDVGPYDYGSIMHYPAFSSKFAIDPDLPVIVPTQSNAVIGQRNGLSRLDVEAAQRIYYGGYIIGPAAARITLYRNTFFGGVSQTFPPGSYTTFPHDWFDIVGAGQASSIAVPPGLVVTACTAAPFPENPPICGTFTQSVTTLPAGLDNAITWMQVDRAVTVYNEASFWANPQTFAIGEYRANAGQLGLIGNDRVSSVVVPPGLVVELCYGESGPTSVAPYCQTYDQNTAYVGNFMNDQASLIRVKPAVTIYQEANLVDYGNRKGLPLGTWSYGAFAPVGNNSISSLVVGKGLKATLCDGASGGSPCAVFRGDVHFVGGLHDRGSWIKVEVGP